MKVKDIKQILNQYNEDWFVNVKVVKRVDDNIVFEVNEIKNESGKTATKGTDRS